MFDVDFAFCLHEIRSVVANSSDDRLTIERRGGLGGFSLPGSHVRSGGEILLAKLSAADRRIIDALFAAAGALLGTVKGAKARMSAAKPVPNPDGFIYCLTRTIDGMPHTIEVTEDKVPEAVRNAVKDSLA